MKTTKAFQATILATLMLGGWAGAQPTEPKRTAADVRKDAAAKPASKPATATRGRGENAVYCKKTPCKIKLEVLVDSQGNCTAIVGPEYIAVASELASVTIQWKVQTAGWTFTPGTGIKFKGVNQPVAARVFRTNTVRKANEWEEFDDNSQPGAFQYAINLQTGPSKKCERDPVIINDMGPLP